MEAKNQDRVLQRIFRRKNYDSKTLDIQKDHIELIFFLNPTTIAEKLKFNQFKKILNLLSQKTSISSGNHANSFLCPRLRKLSKTKPLRCFGSCFVLKFLCKHINSFRISCKSVLSVNMKQSSVNCTLKFYEPSSFRESNSKFNHRAFLSDYSIITHLDCSFISLREGSCFIDFNQSLFPVSHKFSHLQSLTLDIPIDLETISYFPQFQQSIIRFSNLKTINLGNSRNTINFSRFDEWELGKLCEMLKGLPKVIEINLSLKLHSNSIYFQEDLFQDLNITTIALSFGHESQIPYTESRINSFSRSLSSIRSLNCLKLNFESVPIQYWKPLIISLRLCSSQNKKIKICLKIEEGYRNITALSIWKENLTGIPNLRELCLDVRDVLVYKKDLETFACMLSKLQNLEMLDISNMKIDSTVWPLNNIGHLVNLSYLSLGLKQEAEVAQQNSKPPKESYSEYLLEWHNLKKIEICKLKFRDPNLNDKKICFFLKSCFAMTQLKELHLSFENLMSSSSDGKDVSDVTSEMIKVILYNCTKIQIFGIYTTSCVMTNSGLLGIVAALKRLEGLKKVDLQISSPKIDFFGVEQTVKLLKSCFGLQYLNLSFGQTMIIPRVIKLLNYLPLSFKHLKICCVQFNVGPYKNESIGWFLRSMQVFKDAQRNYGCPNGYGTLKYFRS